MPQTLNKRSKPSGRSLGILCPRSGTIIPCTFVSGLSYCIGLMYCSQELTESKGIELKSFSFNINYNRMSSVVVMYS